MIKKNFLITIVIVIFFSFGCKKKLYIYDYAYYIPNSIIKGFEKKYNVKVIFDVYSTESEMYAKLKAGALGYDLVCAPGNYVKIMKSQNMLQKLDKTKLKILNNIDQDLLKKASLSYDSGNNYSMPYIASAACIAVNTKYVKNFKENWNIFLDKKLKKRIVMLNTMRDTIGAAFASLGYSVNSVNKNELQEVKKRLFLWKKNVLKFSSDSEGIKFANEEAWVVYGFAEDIYANLTKEQKKRTVIFFPKYGPMYIDNFIIPKYAKHTDLIYKFFNYLYTPKVYAKVIEDFRLPSIVTGAKKNF